MILVAMAVESDLSLELGTNAVSALTSISVKNVWKRKDIKKTTPSSKSEIRTLLQTTLRLKSRMKEKRKKNL